MSRTVWRYEIPLTHATEHLLRMPWDARIVHVAAARWSPHAIELWAEVDPMVTHERITLHVVGTGDTVPPGAQYLGTAVLTSGYVFHLYRDARIGVQ